MKEWPLLIGCESWEGGGGQSSGKKTRAHCVVWSCISLLCYITDNSVKREMMLADAQSHLDEELLVAGPPLPSKLASPGPARAPRPSWTNTEK